MGQETESRKQDLTTRLRSLLDNQASNWRCKSGYSLSGRAFPTRAAGGAG